MILHVWHVVVICSDKHMCTCLYTCQHLKTIKKKCKKYKHKPSGKFGEKKHEKQRM